MVMRAVVERNSASAIDAHGLPVAAVYATHEVIPCRVWAKTRTEIVDGNKTVTVEMISGIFPSDADITEADRIVNVNNRLGATLYPGPLQIKTLQRMDNHLQAVLEKP